MNLYKNDAKVQKKVCTFALELQLFNKKDVRQNFQKGIAYSQATLPVVGGVSFVLWLLFSPLQSSVSFSTSDYGLWKYVPSLIQEGHWALGVGVFCAALAVYMMAELNNANALLRVGSRMLSSVFALLLCLAVSCHRFQPGNVVMLLSLMSLFPMFTTYQQPSPLLTFIIYLLVSVASLVFPKLLWFIPAYWFIQAYFRAFSLRCCLASIMAVMLPYWFYGCVAVLTESFADFQIHCQEIVSFQGYDYTQLDIRDLITFVFVILLFLTGVIDFYLHRFMDKTRTRIIYNALINYGVIMVIWIVVQPQYFTTLLPLLLIPTSIVFGHFFTLTHTKFSHIYCIVLMVLAVIVLVVQYLPDNLLFQFLTSNS